MVPILFGKEFELPPLKVPPTPFDGVGNPLNSRPMIYQRRDDPEAVLIPLESRLKKGDHRLQQIILLMVKLAEMRPGRNIPEEAKS